MTRTNSFTIKASLTTLLVLISFFCFYISYSDFVKINNEYAYIYDDVDINYFDKKKFQKYYDVISIESLDDPIFDKEKSKNYFENIKHLKNMDKPPEFDDNWVFYKDLYESTEDVDAILILTEWDVYKSVDWDRVNKSNKKVIWVFDTRSIVDKNKIKKSNLNFWCLGKKNPIS